MHLTKRKIKTPLKFLAVRVDKIKEGATCEFPSSYVARIYRDKFVKKKKTRAPHSYIYKEFKRHLLKHLSVLHVESPRVWLKEFVVLDDTITYGVFFSHKGAPEPIDAQTFVTRVIQTFEISGNCRQRLGLVKIAGVDLIPYHKIDPIYNDGSQFDHVFKNFKARVPSIIEWVVQKMHGPKWQHLSINQKLFSGSYFANNTPLLLLKIIEEE